VKPGITCLAEHTSAISSAAVSGETESEKLLAAGVDARPRQVRNMPVIGAGLLAFLP
jgi:hypothetical protein